MIAALSALALALSPQNAAPTRYEPTWESLAAHPTPEWFRDAKFGVFIHWGVYSVPAFCDTSTYSEWYQYWYDTNSHGGLVREFHDRWYGKDFEYREFAPLFRAELFDAAEWAEIFRRAGARYVVLTSKHHDGFCLWPSAIASEVRGYPWNAVEVGPRRDLVGELMEACRAAGVRPGLYYSFMEWHDPLYDTDRAAYVERVMIPQIQDLFLRYQPEVFWPDGEWDHPDTEWRSTEILAWLYEHAADPAVLAVNDRWGRGLRGQVGDFTTTEYGHLGNSSGKPMRADRPFEECRGIGHSFAWNRAEGYDVYASRRECVRMLVDIVSRGGNLLLDVGPRADGKIPLIMVDRLLAIGRWLETNGEAIYGTRRGALQRLAWGRSTTKGRTLYLFVYEWPEDDVLRVPGLVTRPARATLLGDRVPDRALEVTPLEGRPGWAVSLACLHPTDLVPVVRLELADEPVVDEALYPDAEGVLVAPASAAEVGGGALRLETLAGSGAPNLGYWSDTTSTARWRVALTPGARYRLELEVALDPPAAGGVLEVRLGEETRTFPLTEPTGGWADFTWRSFGEWEVSHSPTELVLRAAEVGPVALVNVRALRLVPIEE